jgi:hypothetical protein
MRRQEGEARRGTADREPEPWESRHTKPDREAHRQGPGRQRSEGKTPFPRCPLRSCRLGTCALPSSHQPLMGYTMVLSILLSPCPLPYPIPAEIGRWVNPDHQSSSI